MLCSGRSRCLCDGIRNVTFERLVKMEMVEGRRIDGDKNWVNAVKKQMDPCMHSAEHILNQAMGRLFGCDRCFSAHIERKKSKCDYRFDRMLTAEELAALAKEVNRVIAKNLSVSETDLGLEEARKTFNLSRLPEDAGDRIRIVKIGDYDQCPCIGPHVATTQAIGTFRITSASHDDGVLRIRFRLKRP